ncbi:MAG: hypothetical protein CM1200mP29_08330 [Verrucomicrobiota bacterium]|nr:MAG: hypothetical protein CM1200mP29_08330 [Verrucomicrobiota bacterium]
MKSHFKLPNLSGKMDDRGRRCRRCSQKNEAAKQSDKTAYVMWEPQVSQAKKLPGVDVILDSSRIKGLIVDVLVARREYLRDHPDKVRAVVEAYSRAAHHYRSQPDGFIKLVKSDDPNLSDTEAKSLVAGIQWKNTLEN